MGTKFLKQNMFITLYKFQKLKNSKNSFNDNIIYFSVILSILVA